MCADDVKIRELFGDGGIQALEKNLSEVARGYLREPEGCRCISGKAGRDSSAAEKHDQSPTRFREAACVAIFGETVVSFQRR